MKQKIIRFSKYKRIDDLVLYACTSDYPVALIILSLEIYKLTNYRSKISDVGFLVITLELV